MNSAPSDSLSGKLGRGSIRLRRQFFKLSMREKALALLFVFALVALWFSNQLSRHRNAWSAIGSARSMAAEQRNWLEQEQRIRLEYESLISKVSLEALPTKFEVSSQIDALVRRNGFTSFTSGQVRSETFAPISFHSFPLSVQKVTYPQLKSFVDEVRRTLPYVNLDRINIQPQAKDDQFLNVSFIFKSIEYTK